MSELKRLHVIILAFSYQDCGVSIAPLPGCLVDIQRALYWCVRRQAKYEILTDLSPESYSQRLATLAPEYRYVPTLTHVTSKQVLVEKLQSLSFDGPVVLYYSGHFKHEQMLINREESYPIQEVIRLLLSRLREASSKLTLIFDCCYPSTLDLPYTYDGKNKLTGGKNWLLHSVLLLTAAATSQQSMSTNFGSPFTLLWSQAPTLEEFLQASAGKQHRTYASFPVKLSEWSHLNIDSQ